MADNYADFPDYVPSKALGNDDPYADFPDYAPAKEGAKEPAGFMQTAKDVLTQIPASFNRTAAGLAALPKNIIEGGAQLLGADPDWTGRHLATEQFGIKDPISALAKYLTTPEMSPEPKTKAGETSRGISEVAAASVPMFGAAIKGAQLATALPRTTAVAGPGRRMAEDLLAHPGKAAAGEAVSTVSAGTALGTARDAGLSPEAQMYATMAGGLAPTAALALSPAANMMRAAKATAARTLPTDLADSIAPPGQQVGPVRQRSADAMRGLTAGQTERARGAVTKELQQEIGRTSPQALAETEAIEQAVPGIRLTTAERTESPTLLQAQRQVGENISPEMLASEAARRETNTAAIAQAQRTAQPRAEYDPEFIVDQGRRRIEGARQELANQKQYIAEQEAGIASEIEQAGQGLSAVGSGVRDELRSARQVVKRDMSRLADQLGLNDKASNVDVSGLKGRLVKSYRETNPLKYETGESALREHPAVKQITELADAQSLNGLTTLRSNLQAELHTVLQNPLPGNAGQRRGLAAMIQEIDGFLDNLGTNISDPGLASKYQQFRQAYRTNYIDRFEKGTAYRALREGKRGYALQDEQVARAFFDPNNPAAARQYKDIFGGETPAIDSAAMDSLYRAVVKDGGVSEHALQGWLKRHREVLKHFPTIRRRVENYGDAVRSLGADRTILRQRRDLIENSILNRELGRISKGTGTPEEMIDRALQNPTRMRELMKSMPEHRPAIARAVWERSFAAGKPIEFIDKNRAGLITALGRQRVERGLRLLRALEKTRLVPSPHGGQPPSQPHVAKLEGFLNTGLNQISSRVFAAQSGRTSWRYVGTDIAGRVMRGYSQRQANRILMEAMLDPDLALELTRATKSRMSPRTTQRLHTYLIAAGLGPDETTEGGKDRPSNVTPTFVR